MSRSSVAVSSALYPNSVLALSLPRRIGRASGSNTLTIRSGIVVVPLRRIRAWVITRVVRSSWRRRRTRVRLTIATVFSCRCVATCRLLRSTRSAWRPMCFVPVSTPAVCVSTACFASFVRIRKLRPTVAGARLMLRARARNAVRTATPAAWSWRTLRGHGPRAISEEVDVRRIVDRRLHHRRVNAQFAAPHEFALASALDKGAIQVVHHLGPVLSRQPY